MSNNVYKISQLNTYIKKYLDINHNIQNILIEGEISNFVRSKNGHFYFTLKDDKARISCVMFRNNSFNLDNFNDGDQVIVTGNVSMYEASGQIQLYVSKIQMAGVGALLQQLEKLKNELSAKGYFDQNHKINPLKYPMNIAVVIGRDSAAYSDVNSCLKRRWPIANVDYHYTLVQGASAAKEIIAKLKFVDDKGYDAIVLARGGGSIEDLWCFNDYDLALTIFDLKTFIITGIGHEQDYTIVDFVADMRAPTPTGAIELLVPNYRDVLLDLSLKQRRISNNLSFKIKSYQLQLNSYQNHLKEFKNELINKKHQLQILNTNLNFSIKKVYNKFVINHSQLDKKLNNYHNNILALISDLKHKNKLLNIYCKKTIVNYRYQMNNINKNLLVATSNKIKESRLHNNRLAILLDAYNPHKLLDRGYSLVYQEDKLINTINNINKQEDLKIKLSDGIIIATVKEKQHG